MSGPSTYQPRNAFLKWFEARLPIGGLIHSSFVAYPTPKNLNYWWTFGAILSFMLGAQIVTGIVLTMHYTPHVDMAFNSVEHIMRDVNYGWLLRYLHSTGASMFFLAVYIHMFRGLYYGSYKEPREVLWILGVIIYLLMMATGFLGYTLPWGQMSFWGATVITNFFSAIPLVGESVVTWLWGGYAVGNPTLQRFFSLHYLLPFVIAGVVVLHVWALHVVGQNNPTGIDPKSGQDTVPFSPHATMKDGFMVAMFCLFFAWFVFYVPNYLGHADNYIPANPGVTPTHIVPEWYYLPFYAILRAIPNKLAGVIAMFASIPLLGLIETPRPLPNSISDAVAKKAAAILLAIGLGAASFLALPLNAFAQEHGAHETPQPPRNKWSFAGGFGKFDQAQLQRGFKIYKEVCQNCHGLNLLTFGNLADPGGPGFAPAQVTTIAADYKVQDGPNDQGEMFERNGRLADRFPPPVTWKNEAQARQLYNGTVPPDMSVLAKARTYERGFPWFLIDALPFFQYQEHGVDYTVALLKGYKDKPPEGVTIPQGGYYNEYFPSHSIAMPPPLTDGRVDYTDGSPATVDQYAKDVVAFMMWAAEPHLEARKRIGSQVMIFLIIFAGLMYFTKKKVWADVPGHA